MTQPVLTVTAEEALMVPRSALINIDIDSNDSTGTYGTGIGSGVRVNSSGSTSIGSTGIRMFKSHFG
jgi:hypothetical protein